MAMTVLAFEVAFLSWDVAILDSIVSFDFVWLYY